ncbi:MAG: hypothetical protein U1E02_15870, partial [Hydrogenophaga sp.]|nr:hypothetical protein [Hydrogenophaga sp.]
MAQKKSLFWYCLVYGNLGKMLRCITGEFYIFKKRQCAYFYRLFFSCCIAHAASVTLTVAGPVVGGVIRKGGSMKNRECGLFFVLRVRMAFVGGVVTLIPCFAMQLPESALGTPDAKQIELAVYKKFFLPPEVRECFKLAEQGDAHPFPRALLVHAPYSMRPSLIARASGAHYGPTARYEKFHGWHPTVCADVQKAVTARLEQDSHAPIIVHLNDLSRAGRDWSGKKQPGCSGVAENMARFLHRYFGREGEWKNSPVLLIASTTDSDILSSDLKRVFEKTVSVTPPTQEMRGA